MVTDMLDREELAEPGAESTDGQLALLETRAVSWCQSHKLGKFKCYFKQNALREITWSILSSPRR